MLNPDGTDGDMSFEIEMSCMACGRGIRSWFHGMGAICSDCGEKGITRQNHVVSILDAYMSQKSMARAAFTIPETNV